MLCVVADGIANGLVNIADEATYLLVLPRKAVGTWNTECHCYMLLLMALLLLQVPLSSLPLSLALFPLLLLFFLLLALPVQLAGCTESIELTRSCSFAQREAYVLL